MPLVWRSVDPAKLHPAFRAAVEAACATVAARLVATWGLRTDDEQNATVGKGRTVGELRAMGLSEADAKRFAKPSEPRVSNAKAGQSAHNWGCAIDVVVDANPLTEKVEADWTPTRDTDAATAGDQPDGWYQLRAAIAADPRLKSGAEWNDWPHIEWRDWRRVRAAALKIPIPRAA
jgi:hypothetical protein